MKKESIVMKATGYDKIDGRNVGNSSIKKLTLGLPVWKENKKMKIAVQVWKQNAEGTLFIDTEIPFHQVMDLMIFLARTFQYFQSAYCLPLLYDPENPILERIGLQGSAMQVEICMENPNLQQDLVLFSQAMGEMGELTGERFRTLKRILKTIEYC